VVSGSVWSHKTGKALAKFAKFAKLVPALRLSGSGFDSFLGLRSPSPEEACRQHPSLLSHQSHHITSPYTQYTHYTHTHTYLLLYGQCFTAITTTTATTYPLIEPTSLSHYCEVGLLLSIQFSTEVRRYSTVQYSTVPPHLKHHIRLTSNTEANRTSFCFYLPLPPPSPPSPHTTHLTKQPQLQLLASYNFATAIVVLSVLSATHRATHPHKPSFCDRPPRNCCPSHPSKTIQYAMRRLKIELQ